MTREEAIAYFKKNAITIKEFMAEADETFKYRFSQPLEATDMAIKALEQEPVLDKVRDEILESCGYSKDYEGTFTYSTMKLQAVLSIIDKYKAESERT